MDAISADEKDSPSLGLSELPESDSWIASNSPAVYNNRLCKCICQICNKTIRGSPHNMKIHMRIHTQEKPYTCSEGDAECAQKINCERHILRNHLPKEKAFIIETCKKPDNGEVICLKLHKVTYPKPVSCHQCNKKFYSALAWSQHKKSCKK